MEPFGPCPLLIWDSNVSAGYSWSANTRTRFQRAHVGKDSGSETSRDTGGKGDSERGRRAQRGTLLGRHLIVDKFGASFVDGELS